MPVTINMHKEHDGSTTVDIDLQHYLPLFIYKNTTKKSPAPETIQQFTRKHNELYDFFHDMRGVNLLDDMIEESLSDYSPREKVAIYASPALDLLRDSFRELLKNSVDVFLEHHLKDPSDRSTVIRFNLQIISTDDQVHVKFSDSGAGFPPEILDIINNEEKQLKYIQKRRGSLKSDGEIKGLLGGHGYGLRQLICQILTGKELHLRDIPMKHDTLESAIQFSNGTGLFSGATIDIVTQKAPLDEAISSLIDDEEFILGTPSSDVPSIDFSSSSSSRLTSDRTSNDSITLSPVASLSLDELDLDSPTRSPEPRARNKVTTTHAKIHTTADVKKPTGRSVLAKAASTEYERPPRPKTAIGHYEDQFRQELEKLRKPSNPSINRPRSSGHK